MHIIDEYIDNPIHSCSFILICLDLSRNDGGVEAVGPVALGKVLIGTFRLYLRKNCSA